MTDQKISKQLKDEITSWIKNWFEENARGRKAVIGITGGRDSAIASAMFVEALGNDEVIGIILPYSHTDNIDDALYIVKHLDIEFHVVHIRHSYNELEAELSEEIGPLSETGKSAMQERIKMAVLAGFASKKKAIQVNTSNYSEDWLGYYTRYGDISPFLEMTISEVGELGKYLDFPENFIEQLPSDGLWGREDEEHLGFHYIELDDYLRNGVEPIPETKEKMDYLHENSFAKRMPLEVFPFGDDGDI